MAEKVVKHSHSLISGLVLLITAACAPEVQPTATDAPTSASPPPTISSTVTSVATLTASPTAASTSTPTLEPTVIPTANVEYGDLIVIDHGGFSYPEIPAYYHTYRPGSVTLASDDQIVLLSMSGGALESETPLGEALGSFLNSMAQDLGEFSVSATSVVTIAGERGLAVEVTGELFGNTVVGEVAYALHDEGAFFVMASLAAEDRWIAEGKLIFDGLLSAIEFFSPAPMTDRCPISLDPGYGYTEAKPIGVGRGNALEGPSLERAYLDTLTGPSGQSIEYARVGSLETEGTILDIYQLTISGSNQQVSLYLDMYHLDPFVIPQGFVCAWSTS